MRINAEDWLQAQYSVLGSALIDEKAAVRVLSETEERDYNGACRTVYNAMKALFLRGDPLDPVSVGAYLGTDYRSFLVQLMEISPTAANVDHHIQLCREQAKVLSVREIGEQLAKADTPDQARTLLEKANACMVSKQSWKPVSMSEALRSFMDRQGKRPNFLRWPFPKFNDDLRVKPGRFIILGAEPSAGKTAFSMQCAWLWARDQKVGFFSLETDKETLTERLLSSLVGIPLPRIQENNLTQQEWDKVCMATDDIVSSKLEFVPAAGMTTADIRAKILECRYQIVIIDYLQLIHARGSNRYEQVTNISIELHTMAQSLGVTIMALSQLSRSADDHTPKNSDLRESGQLEQDADIIIILKLEKQSQPSGPRKVFVTKNKEGELFMSLLAFDGAHQTFSRATDYSAYRKKKPQPTPVLSRDNPSQPEQLTMLPENTPVPFTE